jgi:hypothetical protein
MTSHLDLSALSPQELFDACKAREEKIDAGSDPERRKRIDDLLEHWLFLTPLFGRAPLAGSKFFDQTMQRRYPFDFSIAPYEALKGSPSKWRYRKLLQYLRKLQTRDLRQLLVARWLQQEKICEPRQFLGPATRYRLMREFHARVHISANDLKVGGIIHGWLPYFARIKGELESRKGRRRLPS